MNSLPGFRLPPLVAAPTSVAWMSSRSGVKNRALGGQQVSSTIVLFGRVGHRRARRDDLLVADLVLPGVAGRVVGDHVARLEGVEVHEVAHVVGQEDRGAGQAGPDRRGRVADGDVELGVVGALLDRCLQVDGRDGEDARELSLLDARDGARPPPWLCDWTFAAFAFWLARRTLPAWSWCSWWATA